MNTSEEINELIAELEDCVTKAHPFLTTNVGREDITKVVALVRELQAENEALKQEKVAT